MYTHKNAGMNAYIHAQMHLSLFFKVRNDIRELNLTIVIKVPVKLGKKDIWVDSNRLQVTC